jgi:hypothetical protein
MINEPDEWQPYRDNNNYFLSNTVNTLYRNDSIPTNPAHADVDFKKIKLRYEVSVVFALK